MYRRGGEQIEEIIDGAIMEWDLKEFGWESPDFYPKEDEHLELDSDDLHHNHDDLVLDFTNSIRQKIKNIATADQSPDSLRLTGGSTSNMADQYLPKAAGESTAKRNDVARGSVLFSPKRLTGTQKMSCLVDGCKADLSSCRDYHRRHRVCERHSKSPIVTVKGEEKRFCQQCSRFHSLGEFDEVKRSCRKRLDGHNRRRRKSHPEPLYWSSKNFLSGYKGPRILNFGNPQIYATATVRGMWPVEPKTCSESWIYSPHRPFQVINYHQNHRSTTPFNGEDKSPFFLQKNDTKLGGKQTHPPDEFLRHPLAPPGKRRDKGDNHNHKHKHMITSSDEETSLPIDSGGRALYLLSTHPTHLISSSCSNNNNNHHLVQPIESCSFQLLGNISHSKNKPVDSPPIYDAAATKQTNRLLRLGPEGFVGTWSSPNASDFVGLVGS